MTFDEHWERLNAKRPEHLFNAAEARLARSFYNHGRLDAAQEVLRTVETVLNKAITAT